MIRAWLNATAVSVRREPVQSSRQRCRCATAEGGSSWVSSRPSCRSSRTDQLVGRRLDQRSLQIAPGNVGGTPRSGGVGGLQQQRSDLSHHRTHPTRATGRQCPRSARSRRPATWPPADARAGGSEVPDRSRRRSRSADGRTGSLIRTPAVLQTSGPPTCLRRTRRRARLASATRGRVAALPRTAIARETASVSGGSRPSRSSYVARDGRRGHPANMRHVRGIAGDGFSPRLSINEHNRNGLPPVMSRQAVSKVCAGSRPRPSRSRVRHASRTQRRRPEHLGTRVGNEGRNDVVARPGRYTAGDEGAAEQDRQTLQPVVEVGDEAQGRAITPLQVVYR